jgi:heterodisulfide reductase subunit D
MAMANDSKTNTADSAPPEKQDVREIPLDSLNMKQLIELDACTRCGECLTWCPVYDQDAKEDIIPRRKVIDFLKIAKAQHGLFAKIIKSEKLSTPLKTMLGRILGYRQIGRKEIDDFVRNLYECSTCGQCEVVCPAHIETVALWEELRRVIVQAGYGPLEVQQALVKSVKAFDNPWQQPRAARTKWARKAKKEGLIANLPREIKKSKSKVLLFLGCTAAYDVNVKQVAINNINILEALGIDYGILGSEEKCCASVLLRMGDPEHKRVFKENIDLFNSLGIETLISSCSGCFKTIMQDYPRIAPLNFEVLHSIEFIARMLKQGALEFPHPVNRTVTYHDPCHLGRATGGFDAPRMIMEAIPGLELVEMTRNREYSRCCGAGGGLKAGFPDIQNKMAQRRVQEAEGTGAEQLVSCCPFCYQGLNVGITALESQLVMRDISALVAESLLGYDVFERAAQKAAAQAEDKKARQAVRKEARAQKKAALKVLETEDRQAAPAAASGTAMESAPESRTSVEEDPKSLKKAEREKKRAEKRAARNREKASRRKGREDDAEKTPAAAQEMVPEAAKAADADGVDLTSEKNKSVTDAAASDSKTDKERRRAEKRAAREKEKAARRAAREKS